MTDTYPVAMRVLHSATAVLVVVQIILALLKTMLHEVLPKFAEWLIQTHVFLGFTVLTFTGCRLIVRQFATVPEMSLSRTLRWAAWVTHFTLYAGLLVLPVTGYIKLASIGFQVHLFGIAALPVVPFNPDLAQSAAAWHAWCGAGLGVLISIHVLAACFHVHLDGRPVAARMRVFSKR